jgi:hypothetical protein
MRQPIVGDFVVVRDTDFNRTKRSRVSNVTETHVSTVHEVCEFGTTGFYLELDDPDILEATWRSEKAN